MEAPSLSELEQKSQYLQRRITNLKIDAPTKDVPLSGNVIPTGSVFYCRPSRLRELVDRLGGESNVQIVDNETTRGFCRGKAKPALPWTNEVYPTDIGPSCAGIDSETARIAMATTNNCITPTEWDPVKLFQAGSERFSFEYITHCDSILRVLMLHTRPLTEDLFAFSGTCQLSWFLKLYRPSLFPVAGMGSDARGLLLTSRGTDASWSIENADFEVGAVPSLKELIALKDISIPVSDFSSFKVFPDEELCLVEYLPGYNDELEAEGGYVMCGNTMVSPLVPFQIKIFKINSNELLNGTATPEIRYGGYDRKNPPGSGPPPAWGRTNIVQIKTLRDVAVTLRAPEEDGGAGEDDK
ncbi:Hypothetical protein GSB_154707 [Giardia duodenalis]|uniref:Uncharacterized protein n=1 Tax=Giardia intestinalis TaxID=5741 RepID=V6TQ92_GIAIN|nr:Hypothetical protein GSB_154707 [Giardia intestinalis]